MIDPKKQYRTRAGEEVRIYAVDGDGDYPVLGAYKFNGRWQSAQWTATGGCHVLVSDFSGSADYDLIEVKPRIKREVWVNVYRYDNGQANWVAFDSRDAADDEPEDRIACVKVVIDCEEGEGL